MRRPPDTTAFADRRASERTRTTLRGKVFPGGLDCVIKDISKGGARLCFAGPRPAEDRIVVVIWSTGAAVEAVRSWRRDGESGWRFLDRFDLRARVPERLAEVKAQWLGRRRRLRRRELADSGAMIGYRGSPSIVRLS
jgi:hypothetical protein